MYTMNMRVRYSETDQTGKVKLYQILDYFQDCGVFQSMSLQLGAAGTGKVACAWYLLAWDVKVRRYPMLGDWITVCTEPYKMKGFYGYRRYQMMDEAGIVIAEADSIWIYMDTDHMLPGRIPEDIIKTYVEEGIDATIRIKRKLSEKAAWEEVQCIDISRHFLDSNIHVNNAYYVQWAEALIPEGCQITGIKVDYRQSALLKDHIHVYQCVEEGKYRVKYENQDGVLIAIVELSLEMLS